MLLVLKARESAPKRGYFYRSWMTLVNIVAMAKDLELEQHHALHMSGRSCDASVYDCVSKTRCWQLLYVLEGMIGGPQGRFDLGVAHETVDFTSPQPLAGIDDNEMQISRQMVQFARVVRNVRGTMALYARIGKTRKDWMCDPEFVQHDLDFQQWLAELPKEMQINFPQDGSLPWIPSSFVGNMHCYHYLSVILHQRPQLRNLEDGGDPVALKQHMMICHDAAKKMCRIQESILQNFGVTGLLAMQRGISFTIYCVLSCTMLHLVNYCLETRILTPLTRRPQVSVTSPFPELNGEGRDYFVRHMRILEQIAPHWPMPEVQAQINSLREAFSADTSKSFDLKPNFPYGSPASQAGVSPLGEAAFLAKPSQDMSLDSNSHVGYSIIHPITPPISATDDEVKTNSPVVQSMGMLSSSRPMLQSQEPMQQSWNPSRLFEYVSLGRFLFATGTNNHHRQWNVAFGTPPSSTRSHPSPPNRAAQPSNFDHLNAASQDLNQQTYSPASATYSPHSTQLQTLSTNIPTSSSYASPASAYVTPSMWQDVVASSFGDSLKRRWDYSGQSGMGQMAKRQR